jgi:hypothetical protein
MITQVRFENFRGTGHGNQHVSTTIDGRPAAIREDVEAIALPMIRQLDTGQLQTLRAHSRSFSNFADQVDTHRAEILTAPSCW